MKKLSPTGTARRTLALAGALLALAGGLLRPLGASAQTVTVSTLAGTGAVGAADGPGASATFNQPYSTAVDGAGNVYVADFSNHKIRKITVAGLVTTLAGTGASGAADGPGASATFNNPYGTAVDGAGNVYVGDERNHKIRKITAAAAMPTLTSLSPTSGPAGTSVTLMGTGLTNVTGVSFNGTAATVFSTGTGTTATATVPAGASTGNVTVTTAGGTSNGVAFTVVPVITSFTPGSGAIGSSVVISGSGFNATAAQNIVFFGATRATVTAASATSLTVSVPLGATYQYLSVTNLASGLTAYSSRPFVVTLNGAIAFQAKVDAATGTNPYSVAIGDLDGDGKPDLAVANYADNTVSVLRNTSTAGAVSFAPKVDYATGVNPYMLTIGDLDGDGLPDLAVANLTASSVSVFRNLSTAGTLSFAPKADYTTGSNPRSVAIGDVDGDGRPDLATANINGPSVSVFRNLSTAGTVSFAPKADFATGAAPISVAIGDLDGDGRPDLAVANLNGPSVSVLRNLSTAGTVSFAAKEDYTTGARPYSVAIGDLDGDGLPDLAVANQGANTVSVLRNQSTAGALGFAAKADYATGRFPYAVAIGDVDGDGKPDLATANEGSNDVSVLRNLSTAGTASFAAKMDYATGTSPISVAIGDVDGDGKPDLAAAYLTGNTVSVLRQGAAAPVITTLSPASGPVGTSVAITGTGFTSPLTVSFNGTAAGGVVVNSPTQLTVSVPVGAGTGNVTVTTSSGTSNGVAFTVLADLVVSTGTPASPTPIPAGSYNSITITSTGNGVLAGNVSVASFFTVEPGGGLSDGCAVISGAGSFTLGAGSILGICSPQGISSSGPTGSVQVTGARSFSTAANYGYTGAAAATGNGLPATVASLAINTAGNVTLSSPVAVTAAVGVGGAGNLVLNGNNLTLLSSAAGTALARNSSTGVVVGNATVQRFISSANTGLGYRHYSSPVSGSTVSDLQTAGFTPEISQAAAYNTSATPNLVTPFPTVFAYDQSRVALTNTNTPFDRGFAVPGSAAAPLAVGRGYAVNLPASALVDFVGTLNNGAQSVALTRNAAGSANEFDAGWQLVGNPYPAPLDYSLVAPADRAGLDAAIFVYSSTSEYAGTYRAYVNGVGGNPVLPLGQGFFARVSAGQTSATLTFRNSQRLTAPNATAFQRTATDPRPLVQLDLRGTSGAADALYAYAEAGATAGFDAAYDARKLPNSTGLNLASVASTGESLSIDGRPVFAAATVLPLTVGVPAAGTYSLSAAALANLPATLDAFLSDALTGQTVNLRTQPAYTFTLSQAQAGALVTGRFTLHFGARTALANAQALTAAQVSVYPNPARERVTVVLPASAGALAVQAELLNALGQVVRRQAARGTSFTMETAGLAPGVYALRVRTGGAAVSKRVVVE